MNLDHDFVQVSKLTEDKKRSSSKTEQHFFPQIQVKTKKKIFTENRTLFSLKSSGHLRSDAHQSQIIGGDADVDRRVARNSQWGGLFGGSGGGAPSRRMPVGVWGRSPQLPEAGGLGAKPPAAGGTGVWGRSPQRSKILHFFAKITSF